MNIVIIQYNAGNVKSVQFSLERLGIIATVSNDPDLIRAADKVIFPGVGEASSAMRFLREHKLDELILSLKQPVLGICLGMQLMCKHSDEGDTKGLSIFPAMVKKFTTDSSDIDLKIPHMGWNTLQDMQGRLFKGVPLDAYVYYVHSYHAEIVATTSAITNYILPFSAAMEKDNYFGVQFHPEKSGIAGEFILKNFLEL